MHLHNFFQTKHSALLNTFLPEHTDIVSQWEVASSESPTHQKTKMLQRRSSCFLTKKFSLSSGFYQQEPGPYPYITILLKLCTLSFKKVNHNERCITVKTSQKTPNNEVYLANEGSGLASSGTDMGHFFQGNVGIEFGMMLRAKGTHKSEFA